MYAGFILNLHSIFQQPSKKLNSEKPFLNRVLKLRGGNLKKSAKGGGRIEQGATYMAAVVRKDTYVPAAKKKFVLQMSKLERTFGVDRIPMN